VCIDVHERDCVLSGASCKSCKLEYDNGGVQGNIIKIQSVEPPYGFTVNDSPHPQASAILGFLNTNFELNSRCRAISCYLGPEVWQNVPKRIFVPVHFASNDGKESFAVYNDFDTVLLYDFIELCRTVYVFEVIG
jgi:hypothetical protein